MTPMDSGQVVDRGPGKALHKLREVAADDICLLTGGCASPVLALRLHQVRPSSRFTDRGCGSAPCSWPVQSLLYRYLNRGSIKTLCFSDLQKESRA